MFNLIALAPFATLNPLAPLAMILPTLLRTEWEGNCFEGAFEAEETFATEVFPLSYKYGARCAVIQSLYFGESEETGYLVQTEARHPQGAEKGTFARLGRLGRTFGPNPGYEKEFYEDLAFSLGY